jgi:hypothetical protein
MTKDFQIRFRHYVVFGFYNLCDVKGYTIQLCQLKAHDNTAPVVSIEEFNIPSLSKDCIVNVLGGFKFSMFRKYLEDGNQGRLYVQ